MKKWLWLLIRHVAMVACALVAIASFGSLLLAVVAGLIWLFVIISPPIAVVAWISAFSVVWAVALLNYKKEKMDEADAVTISLIAIFVATMFCITISDAYQGG